MSFHPHRNSYNQRFEYAGIVFKSSQVSGIWETVITRDIHAAIKALACRTVEEWHLCWSCPKIYWTVSGCFKRSRRHYLYRWIGENSSDDSSIKLLAGISWFGCNLTQKRMFLATMEMSMPDPKVRVLGYSNGWRIGAMLVMLNDLKIKNEMSLHTSCFPDFLHHFRHIWKRYFSRYLVEFQRKIKSCFCFAHLRFESFTRKMTFKIVSRKHFF